MEMNKEEKAEERAAEKAADKKSAKAAHLPAPWHTVATEPVHAPASQPAVAPPAPPAPPKPAGSLEEQMTAKHAEIDGLRNALDKAHGELDALIAQHNRTKS